MLVWNKWDLGERRLQQAGIAWTAELRPPPPVVVDLLSQNLAAVEAQYGQQSVQYDEAQLQLDLAKHDWDGWGDHDRAAWEAAGWNDHYWGNPWWPTTATR
jgi:hypothetical protein